MFKIKLNVNGTEVKIGVKEVAAITCTVTLGMKIGKHIANMTAGVLEGIDEWLFKYVDKKATAWIDEHKEKKEPIDYEAEYEKAVANDDKDEPEVVQFES